MSQPEVVGAFAANGVLARAIEGFKARPSQQEMAEAVADAIDAQGALVVEAGTGTGKTFAYLVPALLKGGKVIVSTGTKNLQDQLFLRDIPTVRRALKVPVTIALLKGRSNYLCHYWLERTSKEGNLPSKDDVKHLRKIQLFAKTTQSGDKGDLSDVPENAGIWSMVTSTRENCLGQECPKYKDCFVMQARQDALKADVVVVNHHLFFADVMLRDTGMAELLPACNTVIFDEAHQLPETASLFFGETFSSAQMMDLARDTLREGMEGARDGADWPAITRSLEYALRDTRLALPQTNVRMSLTRLQKADQLDEALDKLELKLEGFIATLEDQAERSEGLEACWRRAQELHTLLTNWRAQKKPATPQGAEEVATADVAATVRWIETFNQPFHLHATPLDIAPIFKKQLEGLPRAWVFTSATLSVKGDFSHYQAQMGLDTAITKSWESPFDYPSQAILCVPQDFPDPRDEAHTQAVVDAAVPLLEAMQTGAPRGAFLLFTTIRGMQRAHELLLDRLKALGLEIPVLLQGQGSRTDLLNRFREAGNAVLIGSQSFWEGVDVRGDALSLVVIDKLPFAPPDDPVLSARIDAISQAGGNAFMDYQLPHAVITLKQGAGRLIRDETDRGVLVICDPRLISKPYGRRIWQSLPPMRRVRTIAEAVAFFRDTNPAITTPQPLESEA